MIKRNLFKIIFCLVSVLIHEYGFAAVFHEIDTTSCLKCTFSSFHQNRIAVNNGRITKVIVPEGKVAVQMEEESGQVFIYALDDIPSEVTLSVVTDKGSVQDLEIAFSTHPSEVVILKEQTQQIALDEEVDNFQIACTAIEDILHGEVPKGYVFYDCDRKQSAIACSIYSSALARFEGQCDTIFLYKIFNCRRCETTFHEQQFMTPCTRWIFLMNNSLPTGAETFLIAAEDRND